MSERSSVAFEILDVFFGKGGVARGENKLFSKLGMIVPKKFKCNLEPKTTGMSKEECPLVADWSQGYEFLSTGQAID